MSSDLTTVPIADPAVDVPVIECRNLGKSFGDVEALRSLDLTVGCNSVFGFLGPNGAGKTTAMKLLLGLITPTHGEGRVFNLDIARDSVEIRSRIGYLPQDPRFYEHMTARETLRFAADFYFEGTEHAVEARVSDMLDLVGLADKADRPVKGFSGGERQRLGIAQAQVSDPDLLILDEPAASLDPIGRRDVLDVMMRLREHATIFYSTHILDDVQRVSDTVAILRDGHVVAHGSIEGLLAGGGTVYAIDARGDVQLARERIAAQSWVADVVLVPTEAGGVLEVAVTDEREAEERLLRIALDDPAVAVRDFRRRRFELEDVFLGLMEDGDSDG